MGAKNNNMIFRSPSFARRQLFAILSLMVAALFGCVIRAIAAEVASPDPAAAVNWPAVGGLLRDPQLEAHIQELLRGMTLEQKVAQMVQADIRYVTPQDVRANRLGFILNGGGAFPANNKHASIADWVALADAFYDASMDTGGGAPAIPVMWGTDAVHGHNNVVGATLFPHNIGLGAAHDPDLIQRIGEVTAREVAATGIDWTFAPTVAVVRDARWGRSYEGYAQRPELVREYATRMVAGLQGTAGTPGFLDADHVVATAKHFIGDGGTYLGIDRGDNRASEQELLDLHAPGYVSAVRAGVQTVMASYNSWQGEKLHGQHHLLTEVLKGRMGFDGLVISDWDGIDEVQGCSKDRCARAVNAGVDVIMVPELWRTFIRNTVAQVRAGDIPEGRIDDAVTRILRVKLRAHLFDKGRPSSRRLANQAAEIGAPAHRAVAREAVRKSLVLLKNEQGLLPLKPRLKVLVAGDGADDMDKQTGGWTLTWQGTENSRSDFPGATTLFEGIRAAVTAAGGTATLSRDGRFSARPDVAIVAFGEDPHAEWFGDIKSLDFHGVDAVDPARPAPESVPGRWLDAWRSATSAPPAAPTDPDTALIQRLRKRGIPVVAIFLSGRPRGVSAALDASSAFVAAWLPGSEGEGVADVLFRAPNGHIAFDFSGKLSFDWPRSRAAGAAADAPQFPYGYGLSY
jgi:beta-glucosidase